MFNSLVRNRVIGLVAGIGPSIVSNPQQLESKLSDLAATNPQEVQLIMQAANAGIPEEIAAAPIEHREMLVQQAADWMASETGAAPEAARWAVDVWAAALKHLPQTPAPQAAAVSDPNAVPTPPAPQAVPQPPMPQPAAPQPVAAYAATQTRPPWETPLAPQRPNTPPPGTAWPPQPAPGYAGQPQGYGQNTSGMQGDVPAQIANLKWNWGAFGLPFWWLRAHNLRQWSWGWVIMGVFFRFIPGGMYIRMGALVAVSVALGVMGHKLAWQNRTFSSMDQYFQVQRAWSIWGIVVAVISWSFTFLILFLAFALRRALMGR